ncbi:MAG: ECF-type sigma factor [Gemmatimonadaceae bacterium]
MVPNALEASQLLIAAGDGDEEVVVRLWSVVYDSLKRIAHRELSHTRNGVTLATTDLVHEAYLKCVDVTLAQVQDPSHFLAIVCRAMRQILIDRARRSLALKRSGGRWSLPLEDAVVMAEERCDELLALDEALEQLARLDARLAQLVEYRFFAGFTLEETAGILGLSQRTAEREWHRARVHLYRMLQSEPAAQDGWSHA